MSSARDPLDPSGSSPAEAGAPTQPTSAETGEVHGYMLSFCSACFHQHSQTDPKCNIRCAHGSAYRAPSPPSTFNTY